MAVYGAITKKVWTDGYTNVNRYWMFGVTLAEVAAHALLLANCEAAGHSNTCNIQSVHFWRVGVNPNEKVTINTNVQGELAVTGMVKPEIVARVFFEVSSSSNPMYKDFRVRHGNGFSAGHNWSAGSYAAINEMAERFNEAGFPFSTRNGGSVGNAVASTEYFFRQKSKRWYNRPPV